MDQKWTGNGSKMGPADSAGDCLVATGAPLAPRSSPRIHLGVIFGPFCSILPPFWLPFAPFLDNLPDFCEIFSYTTQN